MLEMSAKELAALSAVSYQILSFSAGQPILKAGDHPTVCVLVLEGFVSTSKAVGNGKRQIMSFGIPGDMPILMTRLDQVLDVDLCAISACRVAALDSREVMRLCMRFPRIAELFWDCALVLAAILREWIVNVGHRSALSRLAHLLCEMMTRLEAYGLAREGVCDLPLTQAHLSDAIGLSRIHVNRSLQDLRRQQLLTFENGRLVIHDRQRLAEVGHFRPDYLNLPLAIWRSGPVPVIRTRSKSA